MSAVTALPWGRELTVDDLDALPDDGHRYELIDGMLLVTPGPTFRHQDVSGAVYRLLYDAATDDLRVYYAPLDVRIGRRTNLQPDLLVTEAVNAVGERLEVAPVLAVEVLSPSTKHADRGLKKSKYEELGTANYWTVDPHLPSITAWELVDGQYVEAGHAEGDEALALERPFPVRIVVQELVS